MKYLTALAGICALALFAAGSQSKLPSSVIAEPVSASEEKPWTSNLKLSDLLYRRDFVKAYRYAETLDDATLSNDNQQGHVVFSNDGREMNEKSLRQSTIAKDGEVRAYVWLDSAHEAASFSAPGVDFKQHFANSYLVGIRPFAVENKTLPLYLLSKMKRYQPDDDQYGASDIWQNSAQAFKYPRGDCEDHAIVLADWLISEGLDARVVLGSYDNVGHAWVVVNIDDQVFLLEATEKRTGKRWNHYPLAKLSRKYQPKYMFNRTDFWVNTSRFNHTDYLSSSWVKRSRFEHESKDPA